MLIIPITKFLIVIGSLCAYLSHNWDIITLGVLQVTNYNVL